MGCLWVTVIWAGLMIMWRCNAVGLFQEGNGVSREVFDVEGDPADVVWVVQVSDLHISAFHPERSEDLRKLLAPALKMIRPSLVLITGDLTDAGGNGDFFCRRPFIAVGSIRWWLGFVLSGHGVSKTDWQQRMKFVLQFFRRL